MAKQKKAAPAAQKQPTKNVAVYQETARMAARVAKDEGLTIAELIEPLLLGPLQSKYRKILERELRELSGPPG